MILRIISTATKARSISICFNLNLNFDSTLLTSIQFLSYSIVTLLFFILWEDGEAFPFQNSYCVLTPLPCASASWKVSVSG
ncbi:hypothetical protein J18TS1_10820 [Oceanobacillus oncorhynchi subsp. incaldanensis]|nr:hypothetical protein J18TS1_10820 [Oceanobacillus oncorhynchi subsp. incaldanensis]